MKIKFTFLLAFSCTTIFAQVPNNSFETWSGGDPVNWQTSNNNTQSIVNVTQVSGAHTGSSAMRMDAWTTQNFWFGATVACPSTGNFFPVTGQPPSLTGWYISNFVSGDKLTVVTALQQNGTSVAGGTLNITNNTSVYQQFTIPLTYSPSNAMPDSAAIGMSEYTSTGASVGLHQGTYVILDDINYSAVMGINSNAAETGIEKIYPNPSNENTWVEYSITENSEVNLGVYDVNGNLVQTLVQQEQQVGRYKVAIDSSTLSQGIYIVRLQTGENYSSMKFTVMNSAL